MHGSSHARANLKAYARPSVARQYAAVEKSLFSPERAVLARIGKEIRGAPVLDIGVGGGRTTAALLQLSEDYLGIDYSPAMIEACRTSFPRVHFEQLDARRLASLGHGRFAFAWFSFNGIDDLAHDERQSVIAQVFEILRPGGVFFFSSHNLGAPREKPWQLGSYVYEWSWNPRRSLASLATLARSLCRYARHAHWQEDNGTHAIRIDTGYDFGCPHCYVDPRAQVEGLRQAGFTAIETMGWSGEPQPPDASAIRHQPHIFYLARKPAAAGAP